jgi:hypothetical protein
MAIDQGLVSSFKAEVLLGVHDFRASGGDTFKIALYTSSATLNANTTAYSATNEVSGTGYSAGGATLTSLGVSTANTSTTVGGGYVDFSDVTWASSTITARGALIYNSTPSANSNSGASLTNPAVAVIDFGSDKTTSGTTFRITFPAGNFTNAIIRTE